MGLVRTAEEISRGFTNPTIFYWAEVTSVLYETKPEIIKRILPPGLEPYEKPYVIFNFNDFKHVNFDVPYQEPALLVPALNQGKLGFYTVGMTLSSDIATFAGRERAGYPKKVGIVKHAQVGNKFTGSCERHGIRYATMHVTLDGKTNDPSYKEEMAKLFVPQFPDHPVHGKSLINYNYMGDALPWQNMQEPDRKAYLTRNWKSTIVLKEPIYGSGEIDFKWSDHDPWAELEVVRVIGASRTFSETSLYDTDIAQEVPFKDYAPYYFLKWDAYDPCQDRDWVKEEHIGETL